MISTASLQRESLHLQFNQFIEFNQLIYSTSIIDIRYDTVRIMRSYNAIL